MNDGGEFESKYCNIYTEELELGKENKNKYEASLLGLGINIRDGKFHVGLFDKRDSFPFSNIRIPDKLINASFHRVYSAIGAESLRIAWASHNPESFSTIKLLINRILTVYKRICSSLMKKINSVILKRFTKYRF